MPFCLKKKKRMHPAREDEEWRVGRTSKTGHGSV